MLFRSIKTLRKIATATKGVFKVIDPKNFAVDPVLRELAKLKKTESKARLIKHYDEVFHWFLLPAFLLLLLEATIRERREVPLES